MSVVHPHPHPRAQEVLIPKNPEIAKTFGQVRVEDWDDRVAGETWQERRQRHEGPEVSTFIHHTNQPGLDAARSGNEVVRCHTTRTAELVLLHDDWL